MIKNLKNQRYIFDSEKINQKTLIVILGMHRSGTSLITRSMEVLNASFTNNLMPPAIGDNPKGFFEDVDITEFNDGLLRFCGYSWSHLGSLCDLDVERLKSAGFLLRGVDLLKSKITHGNFFAIKDPRISRLIPFWKLVFLHLDLSPKYILAIRNPLDIARSLGKRNKVPHGKSYFLWIVHTLSPLLELQQEQMIFVSYNEMLSNPEAQLRSIAKQFQLELNEKKLQQFQYDFLDPILQHSNATVEELLLDPQCPPLTGEIFTTIDSIIKGETLLSPDHFDSLVNSWRCEVERIQSLLRLIDAAESENKDLFETLSKQESISLSLAQSLTEQSELSKNLSKEIDRINNEYVITAKEIAERDEKIAQLTQETVNRGQWALGLQDQLDARDHAITERDEKIAQLNQETVDRGQWALGLIKDLNNKEQEFDQILKSNSWIITKPLREIRRWIFSPVRQVKRYLSIFLSVLKHVYQGLPLNYATRKRHKVLVGKLFPWALRFTNSSNNYLHNITSEVFLNNRQSIDTKIDFSLPISPNPVVSVVIPIYGKVEFTLACLRSIAKYSPKIPFEVVVVDDCSPDNSEEILSQIDGVVLYSNKENQGFIKSCNAGARISRGEYIYFLNNDTEVTEGWLDNLYQTFSYFPGTGLVGSKLIYPNGSLQEAGGIIWCDGSAWNFGKNQDANLPVFNYAREVDYCSGASIMVPRIVFDDLGGFDEHYLPAYGEDSDLALKVRAKGQKVFYQPLSQVIHHEGISSGTDISKGVKLYQVDNAQKLFERWQEVLQTNQRPGENIDSAKDRGIVGRILVLDHCTPTPDQDAGSITAMNLMLMIRRLGVGVTFIPEDNFLYMPRYTPALQGFGVEVLYAPFEVSVEEHLKSAGSRYDIVLIFRPTVAKRHLHLIHKYCPNAKLLYHTSDLHFLRMEREAMVLNSPTLVRDAKEMRDIELNLMRNMDGIIVHSNYEKELLAKLLPDANINLFQWVIPIRGTEASFYARRDIAFIGGYQHSPNVDAVEYFVENIFPIIRESIPGIKFYAVGSNPPEKLMSLTSDDIIVTGYIPDLSNLLDLIRVAVAPLRDGAGIKGKIATALSLGLPCVATKVAAEGMGLKQEETILIADQPEEFAKSVIRLYEDPLLWQLLSDNGVEFSENHYGEATAKKSIEEIFNRLGFPLKPNGMIQYLISATGSKSAQLNNPSVDSSLLNEISPVDEKYFSKLIRKKKRFAKDLNIHDLPKIVHYWSKKFLAPIFQDAGISSMETFFASGLTNHLKHQNGLKFNFLSIGAGNCDMEISIAKVLIKKGFSDFTIECLELNDEMLERGKNLTNQENLEKFLIFKQADLNAWVPSNKYDGIMANQSLHHVMNLEHLFDQIAKALNDDAKFVISDIIGRNGHMRWPEAMVQIDQLWSELPQSHKFNHALQRYEEKYENWDCSVEGFEGIRSQDILPLLVELFQFELFIPFRNLIDIFVDRAFGHNFDPSSEQDKAFIDRVHGIDEESFQSGKLVPTHLIAIMSMHGTKFPYISRGLTPDKCIRKIIH